MEEPALHEARLLDGADGVPERDHRRSWRDWAYTANKGKAIELRSCPACPSVAQRPVRLIAAYRCFAYRLSERFIDPEMADACLAPWISVVDDTCSRYRQGVAAARACQLVLAGALIEAMNPELLELLVTRTMPYGKFKGRLLADLPGITWRGLPRGLPSGQLGQLLAPDAGSATTTCGRSSTTAPRRPG